MCVKGNINITVYFYKLNYIHTLIPLKALLLLAVFCFIEKEI